MAGQEQLAPLGPITEPAAAPVSATPSSADIAQGQQRASSAYGLDPNYRPSQGQSQRDPIRLKQGQWLGNGQMAQGQASGGDPLFAATMAVPTFEVDQQISNVRKQKAELSDWIAKQGEQFKGKAADPYQPAYEQYVGSEQGKFIKDVADNYFEGDVNKAWKGVYDDPELRAQFDRNNRYLAAIGQANKGGYDTYAKIDEAVNNGELDISPDTRSLLEDALNAKWSFDGSSPAHSASKFDQLNERLSVEKLFNEYYKPLVKDAGDQTVGGNRVITEKGRKFLVTDTKEDYDQFIDQFVKKAKKEGQWRNEDELRAYAEGMVGRMEKETWKSLPIGKSGGSSGGGSADKPKTVVGEVEVGLSANYPDNTPTKNPTPVYRVPIARLVDGRSELMTKKDFRDGTGASIKMIPTHLALSDLDGKLYIEGMGEADKGANKDSDSEGDGAMTTNKVPYIGNEKTFELFVGAEQAESAKAKAMQARNSDPMRKQSKPFVDPAKQEAATDYKPEQITSVLKKAGAAKGKTYTMEDWNNASPEARANMMKAYGASAPSMSTRSAPPTASSRPSTPFAAAPKREAPRQVPAPATPKPKEEAPVIHKAAVVRDTVQAQKMAPTATGIDAMRNRMDANIEPGTYKFKNAEEADAAQGVSQSGKVTDPDPKGFFTGGNIVESKIGDKKVFFIMDKTGMRPLSDYFEDKQSAKLVLDAFERGEILEEFISKRSRSTQQAFEKLLNKK